MPSYGAARPQQDQEKLEEEPCSSTEEPGYSMSQDSASGNARYTNVCMEDDSQVDVVSVSFVSANSAPLQSRALCGIHPKLKEKWRTVIAAYCFTALGLAMILTGIGTAIQGTLVSTGVVVAIIGLVLFIPGAYYAVFICCALNEKRGFTWQELPDF